MSIGHSLLDIIEMNYLAMQLSKYLGKLKYSNIYLSPRSPGF